MTKSQMSFDISLLYWAFTGFNSAMAFDKIVQSNSGTGRVATAPLSHRAQSFNCICQVVPVAIPHSSSVGSAIF